MARRYRPRQFSDLLGQEAIAQTLTNALSTGTVAHAYLFTGARGVGKTSCARILAKALNCRNGPTPTPCDQCSSCVAIGEGEDIDVREIDGASNRGIDDVRAIRQEVATRPTRSRYKIYIIDEVHMLTKESFNALLKTLEEPPDHVKFIFATTEIQKVPITIVSRCQRFDFAHLTTERIAEHLRNILKAENRPAEDDALELIARRAAGSMRDAQSLLDQLLAFSGGRLTADAVRQLLGMPKGEIVARLADAIIRRDIASALNLLHESCRSGTAPADLLDQLIDYWRDLLLLGCLGDDAKNLNFGGPTREMMVTQARAADIDLLLAGLDVLTTSRLRLRGTSHALTLVEAAVIRLARLEQLIPVSQLLEQADNPRSGPTSGPSSGSKPAQPPGFITGEAGLGKKKSIEPPATESSASFKTAEELLTQVKEKLGLVLRSRLSEARSPAILGPNTLVLAFSSEYNAAYEYCSAPVNRQQIENALRATAGTDWTLRLERESSTMTSLSAEPAASPGSTRVRWEQTMKRHPLLARASEILDAIPTSIDPEFGETVSRPPEAELPTGEET